MTKGRRFAGSAALLHWGAAVRPLRQRWSVDHATCTRTPRHPGLDPGSRCLDPLKWSKKRGPGSGPGRRIKVAGSDSSLRAPLPPPVRAEERLSAAKARLEAPPYRSELSFETALRYAQHLLRTNGSWRRRTSDVGGKLPSPKPSSRPCAGIHRARKATIRTACPPPASQWTLAQGRDDDMAGVGESGHSREAITGVNRSCRRRGKDRAD